MDRKKFQVTISFEIDDEINALIPAHRKYINTLINKAIIDHYAVSMESKRIWITGSFGQNAGEWLRHIAENRMILYSLLLIIFMITRPQGLFGKWEGRRNQQK